MGTTTAPQKIKIRNQIIKEPILPPKSMLSLYGREDNYIKDWANYLVVYTLSMKLIHLKDVPVTTAHDDLKRQRFIGPGELKSQVQTVNYVELLPGESYTPHRHPDCEECFYVLEGEAKATIENQESIISKGDFLVVEVNEEHTFINKSEDIFKYFQFRVKI